MGFQAAGRFSLIDAHVHYYSCFGAARFLQSASENFSRASRTMGRGDVLGVLLLAETSEMSWFEDLAAGADGPSGEIPGPLGAWNVRSTEEKSSLMITGQKGQSLALVAGRQLVTSEGLEVLALGTENTFGDGKSALATVREVREGGGLPVIAWGAGKWWGKRGKILRQLIEEEKGRPLYLGDSAGRPFLWSRPRLFDAARTAGIGVLPGSDPLPLPGDAGIAGRYGFTMDPGISPSTPALDLRNALTSGAAIRPYGRRVGPLRFGVNQVRLRLR